MPAKTAKTTSRGGPPKAADVDSFVAALDVSWRAPVGALRAALLSSDLGVTERIKWSAPSFCVAGDDRVTFRFPPNGGGVQLIFHRGAKPRDAADFAFVDPSGLVAWAARDRGVVTFASPEDMTAKLAAVAALADAWMRATAE